MLHAPKHPTPTGSLPVTQLCKVHVLCAFHVKPLLFVCECVFVSMKTAGCGFGAWMRQPTKVFPRFNSTYCNFF